jgi:hypothetical protein
VRLSYRTELEGSHWRWRIFSNNTVILQGLAPTRAEAVASVRELQLFIRAPQLSRISREALGREPCTSPSPPIERATVVTSRAEEYRQLARDCRSLARSLPPGPERSALLPLGRLSIGLAAMSKLEEYRARARECETKAAQVHDPEVWQQLLNVARQWDQMADQRAELLAERLPSSV